MTKYIVILQLVLEKVNSLIELCTKFESILGDANKYINCFLI